MDNNKKPYILCAAIHYKDGKKYEQQPRDIFLGFVICGRRHHNCVATGTILGAKLCEQPYTQGFLTSDDRFVDRTEAYAIARDRGQLLSKYRELFTTALLSEDIY